MARVRRKIPEVYTRGVNPLNFGGNGRLARAKAAVEMSQFANMLVGRRKKILGVANLSAVAGAAGSREFFRWRVRTSVSTRALWIVILAIPADSTSASIDSYFQVTVQSPGSGAQSYQKLPINRRNTGTVTPNDYAVLSQRIAPPTNLTRVYQVAPDTAYDVVLTASDYARAQSAVLYEEVDDSLGVRSATRDQHTGTGPTFLAAGGRVAMTDSSQSFDVSYLGSKITISGATTAGNNGTFTILAVSGSTSVVYDNASGASEGFAAGTSYWIGDLSAHVPGVMKEILDDDHDDVSALVYQTHLVQGGHLFSWAEPSGVAGTISLVGANVHDGAFTTYDATAPGHYVWPYKRGTYESALVPCVAWAYAKKTSAAGGNTLLRFSASSGVLATLTVTSATSAVYTATVLLDSTLTDMKIDVIGVGNGSTGTTVYAYGLYQYGT